MNEVIPAPKGIEVYHEANLMYEQGLITQNEALIKLGIKPVPSGDKFIDQKNNSTNTEPLNNI